MDADYLIDRRRLKRRITFWRTAAIFAIVAAVTAGIYKYSGVESGDYIARLTIKNVIHNDLKRLAAIERVRKDDDIKALIVRINSPGGTVVGGEALYQALNRVRKEKPVIAVMDELATSAGYMIAVAADRIIAREGTVTGSIGVLFQTAEVTDLLNKLGIKFEAIKSAPLKAEPSPFSKITPKVRAATKLLVDDMYAMFVDMVAKGRDMKLEKVRNLADGRVYTGRMALKNGLIDAIGGERHAKSWLVKEKKITKSLPIRDIRIRREVEDWLEYATSLIQKTSISERLILDGLVSVWHPWLQ
ncbi:MAG: signal peptide peptidase SppA [Alphaproteobacteria bacterium]|nr:signal peptide peptidase SppA [Alphaproteobacteria bacterium]